MPFEAIYKLKYFQILNYVTLILLLALLLVKIYQHPTSDLVIFFNSTLL